MLTSPRSLGVRAAHGFRSSKWSRSEYNWIYERGSVSQEVESSHPGPTTSSPAAPPPRSSPARQAAATATRTTSLHQADHVAGPACALPVLVAAGLPMAVALATALFAPLATWRIWSVRGGRLPLPS
jgi:hypothetical protein